MAKALPEVNAFETLPIRYEDRRKPVLSSHFKEGEVVLSCGVPVSVQPSETQKGPMLTVTMKDSSGYYLAKYWHHTKYHLSLFKRSGRPIYLYGKTVKDRDGQWNLFYPEIPDEVGRIFPIYKKTRGVSQERLRAHIWSTVETEVKGLTDEVPFDILRARGLPTLAEALKRIHFPAEMPDESCYLRIAYREIFEIKSRMQESAVFQAPVMVGDMVEFYKRLPFTLTGDQKKAVADICADMGSGSAMRRLIAGDVGSGKTEVAMAGAFICLQSGMRTLVLEPTIVLAEQIYERFKKVFGDDMVSFYTGDRRQRRP